MCSVVAALKQQQMNMIKEREMLLKQLDSKYTLYIHSLLQQKTLITTNIRTKYDEIIANINIKSICNHTNNPPVNSNNTLIIKDATPMNEPIKQENNTIIKNENVSEIEDQNELLKIKMETVMDNSKNSNDSAINELNKCNNKTEIKPITNKNSLSMAKTLYVSKVNLKCIDCDTLFNSQKNFQNHMNMKHNILKPYKCPRNQCNQCFKTKTHLTGHIRNVHNKEKRFECTVCKRGFYLKSDWKKHEATHKREPKKKTKMPNLESRFECNVCNKGFFHKYQWTEHCLIHSKEKAYECDVCNVSFRKNKELRVHKQSHNTEERPFKCSVCNKAFASASVKWEHQKKSHWVNPL
eukprot:372741_1